jgi:hypothetical protein
MAGARGWVGACARGNSTVGIMRCRRRRRRHRRFTIPPHFVPEVVVKEDGLMVDAVAGESYDGVGL